MPSFTLAAALVALAASTASASSHYSHPRDLQLAAHGNRMVPRVLPRTGRRIVSRANEATLKCLTDYTFALCDGANCTDMGSVAAGTKCVDNAITWDTSSEASTQDSSAASAGLGSVPVPVPASASNPVAAPAAAASGDAATTVNQAAVGVQLNVNSNTGSTDSSSSDDDYVCDDNTTNSTGQRMNYWQMVSAVQDGNSAAQQTSADVQSAAIPVATPTGAAATAVFSSASPAETTSTDAAATTDAVQLFASATTTSVTPAATSSAPASSGPDGNQVYDGKATYYYQYGVAGSCGVYNSDSVRRRLRLFRACARSGADLTRDLQTYIVALSYQIVDNGAHCGQKVSEGGPPPF